VLSTEDQGKTLDPKPYSIQRRFDVMQSAATTLALLLLATGVYLFTFVRTQMTATLLELNRGVALNHQVRAALDDVTHAFWPAYSTRTPEALQEFDVSFQKLQAISAEYVRAATGRKDKEQSAAVIDREMALKSLTGKLLSSLQGMPGDSPLLRQYGTRIGAIQQALSSVDQMQKQQLDQMSGELDHYTSLLALGLVIGSFVAAGWLIWIRRVQQTEIWLPLESLRHMVLAVRTGDLDVHTDMPRSIELSTLLSGFVQMAAELRAMRRSFEEKVRSRTEELEAAQKELVQAAKLSSLGQLVAGVAHEINNPLTSVLGFTEILLTRSDLDTAARNHLQTVRDEALRLKNLVANLNTFARRAPQQMRVTDLRSIVQRLVALRKYELTASNILLRVHEWPEPVWVRADPEQLLQVLLNLLLNAEHAIAAARDHGHIWLDCGIEAGRGWVSVRDDGAGISSEVKDHIFDPFFTTKSPGQGTGLGLSISYGIVRQHRGDLSVESSPGHGTTVRLVLPCAEPASAAFPVELGPAVATETAFVPRQTSVLVIDDEREILELIWQALVPLGYRVILAEGSAGIEQLLAEHGFDLVLCDLKMPGRNGREVLQIIESEDPSLARRFILMTGNLSEDEAPTSEHGRVPLLLKPFTLEQLRWQVTHHLTEAQPAGARRG
jgi:signal transduction histidine kinase/ActR/RegA family two-component response regulator